MEYANLGGKIKEARINKGYTQEELGEKIDSTGSYIGQIERGERNASMSKIIMIAEALDVGIDYLVGHIELKLLDEDIVNELRNTTNNQKQMVVEIIRIIKKYYL